MFQGFGPPGDLRGPFLQSGLRICCPEAFPEASEFSQICDDFFTREFDVILHMQNHFFAQLRPVPFFATKIPLWCSPGSAWPRLVPPGLAWPRLASKDPRQSGLGIFPKFVTIFSQGILMSFYICKIIFLLNFDPCPFLPPKFHSGARLRPNLHSGAPGLAYPRQACDGIRVGGIDPIH